MRLFGRKSAGAGGSRSVSRAALSRGFARWAGVSSSEVPQSYEQLVRDGYLSNPVAQRAVRLVADGVAGSPVTASDPDVLALIEARSAGQSLIETMALHLLLHGNAYVQVISDAAGKPVELFALRPERVTIEPDARGWPVAYLYRVGEVVTRFPAEDAGLSGISCVGGRLNIMPPWL
jgi:phage portal protein BeeE